MVAKPLAQGGTEGGHLEAVPADQVKHCQASCVLQSNPSPLVPPFISARSYYWMEYDAEENRPAAEESFLRRLDSQSDKRLIAA